MNNACVRMAKQRLAALRTAHNQGNVDTERLLMDKARRKCDFQTAKRVARTLGANISWEDADRVVQLRFSGMGTFDKSQMTDWIVRFCSE